jgi:cytochrome c553
MKKYITAGLGVFAMLVAVAAIAGDAAAGKAKSVACAACHGPTGVSVNPMWPSLAGQQEMYVAKQITAFRDGMRGDPVMAPMAAALSDADIADLAAYYAAQPCK